MLDKVRRNEPSDNMVKLIESKESGIYSTNNVLARLWRIILFRYNLSGSTWHKQLDKYQFRKHNTGSKKAKRSTKGNITRALATDKLSWGVLMTGLEIIQFDKVEIHLHLTRRGETEVVTVSLENDLETADELD